MEQKHVEPKKLLCQTGSCNVFLVWNKSYLFGNQFVLSSFLIASCHSEINIRLSIMNNKLYSFVWLAIFLTSWHKHFMHIKTKASTLKRFFCELWFQQNLHLVRRLEGTWEDVAELWSFDLRNIAFEIVLFLTLVAWHAVDVFVWRN